MGLAIVHLMAELEGSNIREYLVAFADGELAPAQSLEVLRYLTEHPEMLAVLREQQELRVAANRAILHSTPSPPPALRQQIAAMNITPPHVQVSRKKTYSPPRWAVGMAAVLLMVFGFWLGRYSIARKDMGGIDGKINSLRTVVTQALLSDAVTRVHVDCSRFPTRHSQAFPQQLGTLADAVKQDLHLDKPYPDLSSVGFKLVGAGPCDKPLENTAHLLYAPIDPDERDTLSIFVQPFKGQVEWEANKLILLTNIDAAHPVLAWRTERVVYFLVGDDLKTMQRAEAAMAGFVR